MLEFKMGRFSGYATKYSPYNDSRIAVAAANNFGLVGNGRLFVCGLGVNGIFEEKRLLYSLLFVLENSPNHS